VRRLPAPAPFDQSRPLPGIASPTPEPEPEAAPAPVPAAPEVTPGGKFADRLPNRGVAPALADTGAGVVPVSAPAAKPPVQTGTLQLPVQADNGKVKPLAPPVYVPKAPVKGFTAPEADADNPAAPVGALTPQQQARVEHGRPIDVARVPGRAPAGAQNWVNTFQSVGMPPMQAAIMAGNVQVESGFRTDAWNRKENAHGAMQWEGDRWDANSPTSLQYFASHYPGGARDWRDPAVQAEFMKHEGETVPRLKPYWNAFLAAKTPQEAQEALAGFIGYKRGNDHIRLANGLAIMGDPAAAAVVARGGGGDRDATGATGVANAGVAGGGGGGGLAGERTQGQSDTNTGGIFSTLFNKDGLNLSDQQRNALLAAGLGMMAGTSQNPWVNIGQGGLKGLEELRAGRELQQGRDVAAQGIKTSGGQLALEGQRVGLEGQRVGFEGATTAANIAQTQVETAAKRYSKERTAGGLLIIDNQDPTKSAIVPWNEMNTNPLALAADGKIPAPAPVAAPAAAAPAGAPATVPAAPAAAEAPYVRPDPGSTALRPEAEPVAAAVATPAVGSALSPEEQARLKSRFPSADGSPPAEVAAPVAAPSGPPSFVPKLPAKVQMDGRLMAPGMEGPVLKEEEDAITGARAAAQSAISSQVQLEQVKHAMAALPKSGPLAQGKWFETRKGLVSTVDTLARVGGFPPLTDPETLAAAQDLTKLTTRLGFALSSTLGSDNARAIVESAVAAVPGGENSPEGAKLIIRGIEAGNQRARDYYTSLQQWVSRPGASAVGFDDWFNKVNPPEMYGLMAVIPPRAMADVRANPNAVVPDGSNLTFAQQFGQKFGKGALQVVIGGLGAQ